MKKFLLCAMAFAISCTPTRFFALSAKQNTELESLIQQYCYFTHNLIMRACKDKDSKVFLSPTNEKAVQHIKAQFDKIASFQKQYLNGKEEKTVNDFGAYVIDLCNHFGLYYLFSFDNELFSEYSIDEKLDYINTALTALEKYYGSIQPTPGALKQIENALFYNFFSTTIAPILIKTAGAIASSYWLKSIVENAITAQQEGRFQNPFFAYAPVVHDGPSNGGNGNNPCADAREGLAHHICNRGDGQCYEVTGFETNPAHYTSRLIWSLRFISAGALAYFAANMLREAQLPTYLNRLKMREHDEKLKKINEEMRNLRIIYENEIDFSKIKGHRALIDNQLQLFVDYLNHPLKYNEYGGKISVLFYGDPGTGKTLLARAIAKESGAPCVEITADDILNETSKEKVMAIWKLAEQCASQRKEKSAIIYIDEIDCVVGDRKIGLDPQRSKALANLLSIFDGIEKRNPYIHILVIITTNHYENLDQALIRSGRVDHKIRITTPDEHGRREFFESLLPQDNKNLMEQLIANTNGLSGSEIILLIKHAQMLATFKHRPVPTYEDYTNALTTIRNAQNNIRTIGG